MQDLAHRGATELLARMARGDVTSRALADLFIGRIESHDARTNAVVTRDFDAARRRADEADAARARGESWGPLHGLPVTIKDSFETAGLRTTCGHPPLAEHVPARDADAVARLRGAGAVILGKTNTPEMAGDAQTYNAVFGRTSNPWDPTRTPGGSSGGAASALAAGYAALELGSDIGGSIRTPANWCGIYGHKPTHGIVPTRGHIPGPPGTLADTDLNVAGPLARSAEDLDLALSVLAGPTPELAVAWRFALPPPRHASLREYRVAAWLDDAFAPVDAAVRARHEATVDALRRSGVAVDEKARPAIPLSEAADVWSRLCMPILYAGLPQEVFDSLCVLGDAASPADAQALLSTGAAALPHFAHVGTRRHRDWIATNERRARMRAALASFFRDYDVLLMPVSGVPAIPHDETQPLPARTVRVNGADRPYADLFSWIALATATLHPATVAPVGRAPGGLPVGLQIVGPYLEDRTTIDFAARLAALVGGFTPPPGFEG